jgi:hypothetical protein
VNPLQRVKPGALLELGQGHRDGNDLSRARQAFHHRLVETPGVVCSLHAEQVELLALRAWPHYDVNAATEQNFETLRTLWETPDGWALSEAVDVWRHARELALGFHYVWDPRRRTSGSPRAARGRSTCARRSRSRDARFREAGRDGVREGELPDVEFRAWQAIRSRRSRSTRRPCGTTMPRSTSASVARRRRRASAGSTTRSLAASSRARTGFSYFGQNGLDATGASILDAKGPIIASIAANGTGKNLQAWSKNLITCCPTGASVWEQLLGRTHRTGQLADQVECDVSHRLHRARFGRVEACVRGSDDGRRTDRCSASRRRSSSRDVDMPRS